MHGPGNPHGQGIATVTDIIDLGSDREQRDREAAIAAARSFDWLPAAGSCHNCDAAPPPGLRFCDADCRDDWERRSHGPHA